MKIVKCRWMPKRYAMNMFGMIWVKDPSWIDADVINHERIHSAQQRELLYLPFYLFYLIEWLIRLLCYLNWDKAYRNISFEREAYRYGQDHTYLSRRRRYAWLRFLLPF